MLITPLGFRVAVRFARKPIWMPTAPTKLFRMSVLERKFYDADEIIQIQKLNTVYKSQLESIGSFMKKEFYEPISRAGGIPEEFLKLEQKDDEKIYAENDRINEEIAKQKEIYFDNLVREMEDRAMEEKFRRETEIIEASRKASEFITASLKDPESFVTPQNFEAIVTKAMENPVSFEFFIDKSGKKHTSLKQKVETRLAQ